MHNLWNICVFPCCAAAAEVKGLTQSGSKEHPEGQNSEGEVMKCPHLRSWICHWPAITLHKLSLLLGQVFLVYRIRRYYKAGLPNFFMRVRHTVSPQGVTCYKQFPEF